MPNAMEPFDVLCVGMACVDVVIPDYDLSQGVAMELTPVKRVSLSVGGDAANQAMILSRLGLKTRLMTGVGRDAAGAFIESAVREAGADTALFRVSDDLPTSATVISVNPEGKRLFLITDFNATACDFAPDVKCLAGAKVVSLASLLTPPFMNPDHALHVAKAAKENGSMVCVDVVFCESFPMDLHSFAPCMPYVDYLFPNDEEAMRLTGEKDLDAMADVFLGLGVKNVVIKAGKDGCYFKNRRECFLVPSYRVKAVDTTGAGDNFASGFITALLKGKDHRACCAFAHGAAGIAVGAVGASTGVRSYGQVEDFIKAHTGDQGCP